MTTAAVPTQDLLERTRSRLSKELQQGQHMLGSADAHECRKWRECGCGREVGEYGEHQGGRHAGMGGSVQQGM